MPKDPKNYRRAVSALLLVAGLCTVGYAVWKRIGPSSEEERRARPVGAELARLKSLGVKVGQRAGSPVEMLDFENTAICDDDLALVTNLPDLEQIDLSHTPITDEALVYLRTAQRLQVLRLNDTKITDRGLVSLEGSPELWMLHLMNTDADLATAKLHTLPKLRILDVTGSPVGDTALANIGKIEGLIGLGLSRTKVGDAELAQLNRLTRLEVLDLGGTLISDRGAAILRSVNLPSLRALNLSQCRLTIAGLRELSGLRVKRLDLSRAEIPFPDAIAELGKCQSLVELVINKTSVQDTDLKLLAQGFSELEVFEARGTRISNTGLDYLGKHAKLKQMILRDTAVTPDGVARFLAAHPHIEVRHGKEVEDASRAPQESR